MSWGLKKTKTKKTLSELFCQIDLDPLTKIPRSAHGPCTNSALARLVRGYKWLVHIISFVFMHKSFVTTPPPAQRNVEDFAFVSAVPHSNHYTAGAASWQNHDSSPLQSVFILHSNVCLGLSNPYISPALWRQRKSKTQHIIFPSC